MLPGRYDFKQQVKNDTFRRMSFLFNFSLDGLTANMWITDGFSSKPLLELSTLGEDPKLAIEDNRLWIEPFDINLTAGKHKYDIQLTDTNGNKTTYISGIFPVIDDITKL